MMIARSRAAWLAIAGQQQSLLLTARTAMAPCTAPVRAGIERQSGHESGWGQMASSLGSWWMHSLRVHLRPGSGGQGTGTPGPQPPGLPVPGRRPGVPATLSRLGTSIEYHDTSRPVPASLETSRRVLIRHWRWPPPPPRRASDSNLPVNPVASEP